MSNSGNLVLVHNGIIENYQALKELLQDNGFEFHSETDTEVLVNFIQFIQDQEDCKLRKAVRIALTQVIGAYAICIYDKNKPEEVVVAKLGSPLVIGLGVNEKFIGSDATPFLEYTKDAIYLEDGEMATLTAEGELDIRLIQSDKAVNAQAHKLQMDLESIEKGGVRLLHDEGDLRAASCHLRYLPWSSIARARNDQDERSRRICRPLPQCRPYHHDGLWNLLAQCTRCRVFV